MRLISAWILFFSLAGFGASYRVVPSFPEGEPLPGRPALLQFSLFRGTSTDPLPASELRLEHERPIHLFMLDSGFVEYVHEHPVEVSAGVWQLRFQVKEPGQYRVWMQFLPEGEAYTKTVKFDKRIVEQPEQVVATSPIDISETLTAASGDYRVRVAFPSGRPVQHGMSQLTLTVEKNGVEVPTAQLEDYLGAKFHIVGASANKSDFVHAHPGHDHGGHRLFSVADPANLIKLHFMESGFYGLFVQFQHLGVLHTVKFGFGVEKADES